MGKNQDYLVDTRNLCFLCYRPAKIVAAGVKGRVKDKTFSLRCISRFVGVDFQKMMKPVFPPSTEDGSRKFPQVLVTVCSRCSVVTEEFATLHQYMEFTQMKMEACIRSINELMKRTESNSRLVDQFRKKMSKAGGIRTEMVESLRRSMMENCSSTLKRAFPRVKIRKYGERIKTVTKSTKLIAGGKVKPSPLSKKPGFLSTILKTGSSIVNRTALNKDTESTRQSPEGNEGGGLFQCLHCANTFKDTGGLRSHIVRYHREQFFAMFKSSTVSEEQFKVAVELLFQDVRKITANCGNQSTVSYVCTCCGKPFSSQIDTYVHMVQLHHDALSAKLQSIQKDASLLESAMKTVHLPDPSNLNKRRRIRGPYKKKNKNVINSGGAIENSAVGNHVNAFGSSKKKVGRPSVQTSLQALKEGRNPIGSMGFPRTCECGVQLGSRSSWNNHQRLHCKLKLGVPQPLKNFLPAVAQHPLLKKAKNTVGFPRTCGCGVRLSLRTSWTNHQRLHCKLKFGMSKAGSSPKVSNIDFENAAHQAIKTADKTKKKGKLSRTKPLAAITSNNTGFKKNKYECECGSVSRSYSSWYHHTRRGCKLKRVDVTESLDLDIIEEVPIEMTASGDLCLPSTSTSIETSPVPKIMNVTSRGGVIKGLQNLANLQGILKKENEEVKQTTVIPETSSYTNLFSKYFSTETPKEEIKASLQKVLQEYRKFPGNISGCPFCGRGFSQVAEIQNHMVEAHFDEVLNKLRNLIDPSGKQSTFDDGVINIDPNLVKSEMGMMEIDVPTDELCTLDLQPSDSFQTSTFEDNELGNLVPKDEVSYHQHDESTTNDNDGENSSFLILP